jgi:hypothetical protein
VNFKIDNADFCGCFVYSFQLCHDSRKQEMLLQLTEVTSGHPNVINKDCRDWRIYVGAWIQCVGYIEGPTNMGVPRAYMKANAINRLLYLKGSQISPRFYLQDQFVVPIPEANVSRISEK